MIDVKEFISPIGIESLVSENKSNVGHYLLAIEEGTEKPIGCLSIAYSMNMELGGFTYILDCIYVIKEWRGKGVFKELFNEGL